MVGAVGTDTDILHYQGPHGGPVEWPQVWREDPAIKTASVPVKCPDHPSLRQPCKASEPCGMKGHTSQLAPSQGSYALHSVLGIPDNPLQNANL